MYSYIIKINFKILCYIDNPSIYNDYVMVKSKIIFFAKVCRIEQLARVLWRKQIVGARNKPGH